MSEYKCRVCGASASIDPEHRTIVIRLPPLQPPKFEPFKPPTTISYPSHVDCELFKPIDKINFDKLIKVEEKQH